MTTGETHSGEEIELVGTVRADAEVEVIAEASGRLTFVGVELADQVSAGATLARIENSSQAAALLQAEGGYDSALANAAIANVSENEAQQSLADAIANAGTTLTTVVSELQALYNNQLDTLFADNAEVYRTPGIITRDDAPFLRTLDTVYDELEAELPQLQRAVSSVTDKTDVTTGVQSVRTTLEQYELAIETFRTLIDRNGTTEAFDADTSQYLATLTTIEQQLASIRSRLTAAVTAITRAEDAIDRAELTSSERPVSSADAQIKQALGSLRSAQAAFNRTIISAPISGAVASLAVEVGQVVSNGQVIATISNNSAFEIVVFVTPAEAASLSSGSEVRVGSGTGRIQAVAPGVSGTSGKVEVRIQSTDSSLVSGETVTVGLPRALTTTAGSVSSERTVPLTAVKFSDETATVFTVDEENTLVANTVTLGRPQGGQVTITAGAEQLTGIVKDVRGLVAGQTVNLQ